MRVGVGGGIKAFSILFIFMEDQILMGIHGLLLDKPPLPGCHILSLISLLLITTLMGIGYGNCMPFPLLLEFGKIEFIYLERVYTSK